MGLLEEKRAAPPDQAAAALGSMSVVDCLIADSEIDPETADRTRDMRVEIATAWFENFFLFSFSFYFRYVRW